VFCPPRRKNTLTTQKTENFVVNNFFSWMEVATGEEKRRGSRGSRVLILRVCVCVCVCVYVCVCVCI
jgi:hypothetical protein